MKRLVVGFSLAAMLVWAPQATQGSSKPVVQGNIRGLELAPQFLFGSALFVGLFQGQVGHHPRALGTFAVAATHEDLPDAGYSADLTGGAWEIRAAGKRLGGFIAEGILVNNGDNTFQLFATLQLTRGGIGQLYFFGELNHNVFPPTLQGKITQQPW